MAIYPSVDFITWLSGMELEDLLVLTLGSFVDFTATSLEASGDQGAGG